MGANDLGEIRSAIRACERTAPEGIRAEFLLPEAPVARGALRDRMVPAIDIQEDVLFRAQAPRSSAIGVRDARPVRPDGIARHDALLAQRTLDVPQASGTRLELSSLFVPEIEAAAVKVEQRLFDLEQSGPLADRDHPAPIRDGSITRAA